MDRRAWTERHLQETRTNDGGVWKAYYMDLSSDTADLHGVVGESVRPRCCLTWFCFVLGVSTTFIYQPHVRDTKEYQVVLTGRVNTKRDKTEAVVAWLLELAKWACLEPDTEQTALPFSSWTQVWGMYEEERPCSGLPRVSPSHFKRARRTEVRVKHLVLRRYLRFAKCDECVEYRRRRNATRDEETLAAIGKAEREHKCRVREERGSYWRRRDRGTRYPDRYMSVIIDGADQSAFGVPHFREKDHLTQGAHTMAVKIMGAIVHGFGAFAFTHLDHVKSGANATIDVLVRVLQIYKDERGALSRKLYLQLDNTVKQCKNSFLMSFLSLLVGHGVFEECVVSFLPVGHTHEDIDQLFSRFAVALRKSDFHSRLGLGKILEKSYHMRTGEPVRVTHLSRWTNFSDWLKPSIKASAFEGITKFKQFLIARNGSGETVIQVREHCARKGCRFDRGIREGTAVTKPWKQNAPGLCLEGVQPAQRRELVRREQSRAETGSSSSHSDAESESENVGEGSQRKRELALENIERTKKVDKVRRGCEKLMRSKGTGPADRAHLEEDLDLLCGVGELPLDLPYGRAALQHLVRDEVQRVASGNLVDSRFDVDVEGDEILMMSGYAITGGMHVAVLVDPKEKNIHKRWNYGEVTMLIRGSNPMVRIRWHVRTSAKKPSYRPSKQEAEIEPDCIQCEVKFTQYTKNKGFSLKKKCVNETLGYFLDKADVHAKPDSDSERAESYGDSC